MLFNKFDRSNFGSKNEWYQCVAWNLAAWDVVKLHSQRTTLCCTKPLILRHGLAILHMRCCFRQRWSEWRNSHQIAYSTVHLLAILHMKCCFLLHQRSLGWKCNRSSWSTMEVHQRQWVRAATKRNTCSVVRNVLCQRTDSLRNTCSVVRNVLCHLCSLAQYM